MLILSSFPHPTNPINTKNQVLIRTPHAPAPAGSLETGSEGDAGEGVPVGFIGVRALLVNFVEVAAREQLRILAETAHLDSGKCTIDALQYDFFKWLARSELKTDTLQKSVKIFPLY